MSVVTIIDEMLAEQQRLTAVERFARQHESGALPAQSRYYQSLIPLEKPRPGEQYAFGVDLDLCTGCKACVSACHSLNGLDEDEIWRNVGFIHGGTREAPYQQTVTTACHHCVDPACLNGCPVEAYEKDETTGIVRHLDDQCIGCQYCVLKCPYDVPKYSEHRGIVRKCDMCYHRLAVNEAPACVQACPTSAITIRIVSKQATVAAIQPGDELIPGAFDSNYTKPTTSYTTRKEVPLNARPADFHHLRLEHAHWPLVWMLVLTQWSAGLFTAAAALALLAPALFLQVGFRATAPAFAILNLGLAVSVLHLGRPLGAWRFFLGLRRSWMSREILGFSLFSGAAGGFTLAAAWPMIKTLGLPLVSAIRIGPLAVGAAGIGAAGMGLIGVACSAMIYIDTQRPFWTARWTLPKFFGTTFVLGLGSLAAVLAWGGDLPFRVPLTIAVCIAAFLLGWEFFATREALLSKNAPAHRSALIQWRLLGPLQIARLSLSMVGLAGAGLSLLLSGQAAAVSATASVLLFAAVFILERYSYFAAGGGSKMPGGVST